MPARKIQDEREVLRWFEEGRSYAWMCQEYERKYNLTTTVSMWGNFRRTRGLSRRVVWDVELVPWAIAPEHRWDEDARMLRIEARRRTGAAVREHDLRSLALWRERLDRAGAVVDYDPQVGFSHVPRRVGADTDLVRAPGADAPKRRRPSDSA